MFEAEVYDYYHTGKYALEYMTSPVDVLARLEIGLTRVDVYVEGEAEIIYKGKVFRDEDELTQEVIRLIGQESTKIDIQKSPKYKVSYHAMDGRRVVEKLGMIRLPSPLVIEELLDNVMRTWLRELEPEGLIGEDEKLFLTTNRMHSYQVKLLSHIRATTAFNHLEAFIDGHDDILMYAGDIKLLAETDAHKRKWLSVSYRTSDEIHRMVVDKMKEYGTPED